MRAIARRTGNTPGRMNKTEERYSWQLEAKKQAGEVLWWAFEPVKLRLADKTFYSPDFLVVMADSTIEMHEVKQARAGQRTYYTDDSRVKIKVAAAAYPMFGFVGATLRAKRDGGHWEYEGF